MTTAAAAAHRLSLVIDVLLQLLDC